MAYQYVGAGRLRRGRDRSGGPVPWADAAILILTSVAFAVGVNALSPERSTVGFLGFWIMVLILVLWLCGQLKMLAAMRSQTPDPSGPSPESSATDSDEACE